MTARPPRYCPCGKRLAHDRGGTRCRACEQELVNLRAAPSAVPADFWNTDQLRDVGERSLIPEPRRLPLKRKPAHCDLCP